MYEDARDHPCYYCLGSNDYTFHPRVYGKDGFGYAQAAYDSRYNSLVCKRSDLVSKEELGSMNLPRRREGTETRDFFNKNICSDFE